MENKQKYLNDLAEIRSVMERSTRFMSLSGASGILAGLYALAGVWVVDYYFNFNPESYSFDFTFKAPVISTGLIVLLLSIASAIFLSVLKAKRNGEKIWSPASKHVIINMLIPLFSGGIFVLIMLLKGLNGLILPTTMIFYGLALFSAGIFTLKEIRVLGILQVFLGLIALWFVSYSLYLWAIGFGLMHIVYGTFMHFKYKE